MMQLLYDCHTHILPKFDDGAKDANESVKLLHSLTTQGVNTVLLTSHYISEYGKIDSFVKKRETSLALLRQEAERLSFNLPTLVCGAEVALSTAVIESDDLHKLCIGDTNYLLLELSTTAHIDQWIVKYVETILNKGIRIIIAHHERNLASNSVETLKKLRLPNVYFQINAGSVINDKYRKGVKALIKENMAHIIGSDCHNLNTRRPHMLDASNAITKHFGQDFITYFNINAQKILANSTPVAIPPKLKRSFFR